MIAKVAAELMSPAVAAAPMQIGRSVEGRPIVVLRVGNPHGRTVLTLASG